MVDCVPDLGTHLPTLDDSKNSEKAEGLRECDDSHMNGTWYLGSTKYPINDGPS